MAKSLHYFNLIYQVQYHSDLFVNLAKLALLAIDTIMRGKPFELGNKAAAGRRCAPLPTVPELVDAMMEVCTPEVMKEVTRRLLDLIRQGRSEKTALAAIELFYDRVLGKVIAPHEVRVSACKTGLDARNYSDEQLAQMLVILENPLMLTTSNDGI